MKIYCSNKETFLISGIEKSKEEVISRFMNINSIKNMYQYLLIVIYNAPITIDEY